MYLKMNEGKLSLVSIFLPVIKFGLSSKNFGFWTNFISYYELPNASRLFLIFICISSGKSMMLQNHLWVTDSFKVQGRPMDSNTRELADRKVSDSRIYHMSRFGVVSEKNAHNNGKGY